MVEGPVTMIASRPRLGALALVAALALAAPAAASASASAEAPASSQPATFALSPVGSTGALLLHGAPGRVLHGAVSVRDVSRHPVTVILQPADIETASNGNADYVTAPLARSGRWLHLAATTVRLEPGAARQV